VSRNNRSAPHTPKCLRPLRVEFPCRRQDHVRFLPRESPFVIGNVMDSNESSGKNITNALAAQMG
jgi:hypothetical protein